MSDRDKIYEQSLDKILHHAVVKVSPELIHGLNFRLGHFETLGIKDHENISELLQKEGIRNFLINHTSGTASVVIPFSKQPLLLKISNKPIPADMPEELYQPLQVLKATPPSIAVYGELNTKDVKPEHVLQLAASLYRKGLLFFDAATYNVGLLEDGTPVIIDMDAIVPLKDTDEQFIKSRFGISYRQQFTRQTGLTLEDLGQLSKQSQDMTGKFAVAVAKHQQALRENGAMNNLFTQPKLERLSHYAPSLSKAVEELGLDGDMLRQLLFSIVAEQERQDPDGEQKSWRTMVAERIAELKKTQRS